MANISSVPISHNNTYTLAAQSISDGMTVSFNCRSPTYLPMSISPETNHPISIAPKQGTDLQFATSITSLSVSRNGFPY